MILPVVMGFNEGICPICSKDYCTRARTMNLNGRLNRLERTVDALRRQTEKRGPQETVFDRIRATARGLADYVKGTGQRPPDCPAAIEELRTEHLAAMTGVE